MGLVLLIVLLLVVRWPAPLGHHSYGYGPSGIVGVVLVIVLILLLLGRIWAVEDSALCAERQDGPPDQR